jgi:plastocyanin
LEATINDVGDSVSSGFLVAAPQDRVGLPQASPGLTRIRITFNHPGTYNYICALHDVNGMLGTVIVDK